MSDDWRSPQSTRKPLTAFGFVIIWLGVRASDSHGYNFSFSILIIVLLISRTPNERRLRAAPFSIVSGQMRGSRAFVDLQIVIHTIFDSTIQTILQSQIKLRTMSGGLRDFDSSPADGRTLRGDNVDLPVATSLSKVSFSFFFFGFGHRFYQASAALNSKV